MNGDGVIDSSDLKELMKNIGKQLDDFGILEMILEADQNGDGVVDFQGMTLYIPVPPPFHNN